MRRILFLAFVTAVSLWAQEGGAPNGYYPNYYHGATFTGVVVNGAPDVLTLQFTKKDKTQTFTGRFREDCRVPGVDGTWINVKASELPRGDTIEAFYWVTTTKVNGHNVKENQIIAISPKVASGKEILEKNRVVYYCVTPKGQGWPFRVYDRRAE